ncbi:MAG: hypothetical protein Q8R92_14530 [Deltaproteobacteria bacterium]|nr:hypothetical protein [Deltaproteobacteria bacterium]
MKPADTQGTPADARAPAAESGTEVLTDGILLTFKFVETHLIGEERRFYKELKPGEYIPLESLMPIWEALVERIPKELKAAIKGMIFRTKSLLAETGVRRPADAMRVSNVLYQTFNRGPRLGGVEAVLRAFGARAVRIEHLTPCQRRGERYCRYRGRWSGVKQSA